MGYKLAKHIGESQLIRLSGVNDEVGIIAVKNIPLPHNFGLSNTVQ